MENIINADYQVVQERTLPVIISEIKTIEAQVYKTAIDGAAEIGARLMEAKEQVGHGNWIAWCEENLNYTPRQAQNFIKIHETYGDENSPYANTKTSSYLSISKALALLQVPEEEVEAFTESHDVEDMTVKKLEEEIREWRAKTESLQETIEEVSGEYEILNQQTKEKEAELEKLKAEKASPEEIQRLQSRVEKKKEELRKMKEELEKEKEERERAIQAALEEEKAKLEKEAEEAQAEKLKAAEESKRAMEEQLAKAEKKLKLSNNEDVTLIKLHLDTIQKSFIAVDVALDNVGLADKEQEAKLKVAAKKILQGMIDKLEG
ncbi:DUF3102 domain-containing protein [Anaerovorax odorimutans]|uniref:DUF3102 domain-containing protein n=1 Tax=Anaerovorax odorimutans TaxID=109327 RepID=A0ABT1RRA8_9FIRM|nr:DUF3102 domain-containing protein [Anaerovorax odorimutans]MCQ4637689.1 DUF3102 domain-containing protein [Anaerovorax odorimutans]